MCGVLLERVKGIEPSSSAWKAVALPLSYTRIAAPPTGLVGEVGLEPTKASASGFTVRPLCHSGHSPVPVCLKFWRANQYARRLHRGLGSAALCAVGVSLSTDPIGVVLTPASLLYRMPD